jgi:hypothetical protein
MSKNRGLAVAKINEWVADLLADYLSTMACFWIITSMVVVVLFWQRPTTVVGWITYISTAIFQASALPVLAFVAKKQGDRQEALLRETHDTVMGELSLISQSHDEIKELVIIIHKTFVLSPQNNLGGDV